MKITRLRANNYRTLVNLDVGFPSFYTAICGKNDSGKTNVVNALRRIFKEEEGPYFYRYEQELSLKDDFPKWNDEDLRNREIQLGVEIEVNKNADAGLHAFLEKLLSLDGSIENLSLFVKLTYKGEKAGQEVTVDVMGKNYTGLQAQEVLKRLQSPQTVLFYNSTELDPRLPFGRDIGGFFRELISEYSEEIDSIKLNVDKKLSRITKGHQKQFTELLGRLSSKYRVALSLPPFDIGYLPYNMSLGQGKVDVPLDKWGSGTRNRTLIFLTLFRARQISESSVSASKITPVIFVEEPESFLHPSAQAEFGKVLQDLSEEFKVQVLTTTHSPYMLSMDRPESNILLDRNVYYNQPKETIQVITTGEQWMEPFGLALGVQNKEFEPWKALFFSKSQSVLFVEGDTDKQYFELLRNDAHGSRQLKFAGEIFAYCGKDALKQTTLLKYIWDRHKKMFITFDLDALEDVEKSLKFLGLERNKHFLPLGVDEPGKEKIEGLLPNNVKGTVMAANPGLVEQLTSANSKERESAKNQLKRLYLEEFKSKAVPGQEYYGKFYEAVRIINNALG